MLYIYFYSSCSCLAGESVHFYEELQQLDKIPINDPVRRIYMARHIIEKYIVAGRVKSDIFKFVILYICLTVSMFDNCSACFVLLVFVGLIVDGGFLTCICIGAPMEVNISHHCRQDILNTTDLAHPQLFQNALGELMQLMKLVRLLPKHVYFLCSYNLLLI